LSKRTPLVFALDEQTDSSDARRPINQDGVGVKRGKKAPNSLFSLSNPIREFAKYIDFRVPEDNNSRMVP